MLPEPIVLPAQEVCFEDDEEAGIECRFQVDSLHLDCGDYKWNVFARNNAGSGPNRELSFRIGNGVPPAPGLIEPILDNFAPSQPTLRWAGSPDADAYWVFVRRDWGNFKQIVYQILSASDLCNGTNCSYGPVQDAGGPLAPGRYHWEIITMSPCGWSAVAEENFRVQ
jgi:hypothetical protein